MIPGPPPVMIEKPASPSSREVSRARAYSGWSGGVRAEPNTDTAAPTWPSASKPVRSSSSTRPRRSVVRQLRLDVRLLGGDDLLVEGGGYARLGVGTSAG